MKPVVIIMFVVFLALSVESASHRRHKASNVKTEDEPDGGDDDEDNGNGGDVEWPAPARIKNFEVPDVFKGNATSSNTEPAPVRHHGKSRRRNSSQ